MIYRILTIFALGAFFAAHSTTLERSACGQNSEFREIFNGENLEGWYGLKTMDPRKMKAICNGICLGSC